MNVPVVVFLSLVLDLFAFTIPLPLFPRIVEWFTKRESSDPNGLLSQTLKAVSFFRTITFSKSSLSSDSVARWDVVLLGGLMGSLFSTLQFVVSPWIGKLSDKYGRKRVLLWTMLGNILSALIWIKSTTWATYLLSRAVGGLSEGNVQLATAILSDVTTPATRSRTLALIGIAFSICFVVGPPIGAYFSTHPFPLPANLTGGIELNVYATPAIITLVLLILETLFLALALPETRGRPQSQTSTKPLQKKNPNGTSSSSPPKVPRTHSQRLQTLSLAKKYHFLFLALFSGIEFTLTFLTFDLFDWSNSQNGRLLAFIGILSALLQGGYTRRFTSKIGEGKMARRGVGVCAVAFGLLATLPSVKGDLEVAVKVIYMAAAALAFTSASVVSSLTALASLQCDHDGEGDNDVGQQTKDGQKGLLAKGRALGGFRSAGQLGRAIGPLLASFSYWTFGPSMTYGTAAASMLALAFSMREISSP